MIHKHMTPSQRTRFQGFDIFNTLWLKKLPKVTAGSIFADRQQMSNICGLVKHTTQYVSQASKT